MTKIRQDAWSQENDQLLANTVLRHIKDGSTQLNAFEEVGDILNRTAAACGFRWNAVVRNTYQDAIELAKKERKAKKRSERKKWKQPYPVSLEEAMIAPMQDGRETTAISFSDIIQFLERMKQNYDARKQSFQQLNDMQEQTESLLTENIQLKKQLEKTEQRLQTVETDYQTFIQIMDRARKLTLLEEHDEKRTPMFRMDKNGNLEQYMQG